MIHQIVASVTRSVRQRYQCWIDRRLPPVKSVTLNQRRIFIFPSKAGLYFLLLLLILLLTAINYQNNMVFALSFLLISVFVVTILHTYANFSGLTISAIKAVPNFVGEQVEYQLSMARIGDKHYFDIYVAFIRDEKKVLSLTEVGENTFSLYLPATKRGVLKPGRLRVETYYPLGLMRAWTFITLDVEALVYPRPMRCRLVTDDADGVKGNESVNIAGSDDFYEFKSYQAGDPLKHVFWKAYAKGQPLQTKHYTSYQENHSWLDWKNFAGNKEIKLQCICYWALQLEDNKEEYGLRIPGLEIEPSHGKIHLEKVLRALALFGLDTQRVFHR